LQSIRRPGPGRIASQAEQGFMSAQRRENRSTRATKIRRREARCRWQLKCTAGAGADAPTAQQGCVSASGRTAPPGGPEGFHPGDTDQSQGEPARLATKSLRMDRRRSVRRFDRLVRIVGWEVRRGSPPFEAEHSPLEAIPTPGIARLSPPPNFLPSRLNPPLPEIPAGQRRWAERYDGKRDLYFLHAA